MSLPTRYQDFVGSFETAKRDDTVADWRKSKQPMYDASKVIKDLQRFQTKASGAMFVYMFGEQLGAHLWEKFADQNRRNMLTFLNQLTDEYRIFIVHEIQLNPQIWIYG